MGFLQGYARKLGVLDYKGTWDANSNTPELVDSIGNKGEYYIVSVAGNTNINGETDWQPGDWVLFSGTSWQKVDNSQYDITQQLTLYENNPNVYADAYPGIPDPTFREGWYFKNTVTDQKINWYFFDGSAEDISLDDFSCYAIVTFDSIQDKPFFSIYTIGSGTGDAGSWYRSRIDAVPINTAVPGVKYLMYFGKEPKVHASLPRLSTTLSSSTIGPQESTERISTASISSNSEASLGDCNFIVETLGLNSTLIKRELNLKIRKANQTDLTTETVERTQSIESLRSFLEDELQRLQIAEYNLQLLTEEAKDRSFHTGVQLSSTISDFVESVHSSVTSLFEEGNDISFIYPNENGKIQALLNPTGVTAGSYNTFTVDSRGRIIAASNTESGNAGLDVQITTEINSTTLTSFSNIVGLETGVLLPGIYRFTFMGLANSTSTSTGIGVKLDSNNANISTVYGKYSITQSVPGTTQSYEYDQISQNTNITSTSSVSTYFSFVIQGEGVVRVLTNGSLVMKFRSEVNGSAVSINPDSILKLEKL